jgi:hypothetical protein
VVSIGHLEFDRSEEWLGDLDLVECGGEMACVQAASVEKYGMRFSGNFLSRSLHW